MIDRVSPSLRSRMMSRVRKGSQPELRVRRLVFSLGYWFLLHRRNLPGTLDLVFSGQRKAIFIHGCFWHQHDCPCGTKPASNTEFWSAKLARNAERNRKNFFDLTKNGWSVIVIRECKTISPDTLTPRIIDISNKQSKHHSCAFSLLQFGDRC